MSLTLTPTKDLFRVRSGANNVNSEASCTVRPRERKSPGPGSTAGPFGIGDLARTDPILAHLNKHWRDYGECEPLEATMMDLDHAYKSLRPSQLCNELALRFEVASIVYADDDSQKLFDRLEEQEIWAFRGYDHSKERYTGDYDVEGFGSVHARNLSSIRAPRSFRALFARPTAIGADMAKEAESSIQSAVARMNTLLDNLSPLEFEQFVAEVLYKRGFKCLLTPATGDNGVDVFAVLYHADDSDPGDVTIVQCKRTENIVGVDLVRELAGAKLLHNSEKALLVTTSHFSRGAHKLVKDPMYFGIELADLYALREWWLKAQGYTTSPTPLTGPTSACIARRSVPLRAPRD